MSFIHRIIFYDIDETRVSIYSKVLHKLSNSILMSFVCSNLEDLIRVHHVDMCISFINEPNRFILIQWYDKLKKRKDDTIVLSETGNSYCPFILSCSVSKCQDILPCLEGIVSRLKSIRVPIVIVCPCFCLRKQLVEDFANQFALALG